MKKIIFSKNYSLIVLLILILYLVFINLPDEINNNVMIGGNDNPNDNNPLWNLSGKELNDHLIQHSFIYKFLSKYIWVYILIIILLIIPTIGYGYTQYNVQGIPIINKKPALTWWIEGREFINYFYLIAKQKYGLFTKDVTGLESINMNSTYVKDFEKHFDNFITSANGDARVAVDLFCNLIAPCSTCECTGPDTNYDGPILSAPLVPYGGIDSLNNMDSCKPKLDENMTNTNTDPDSLRKSQLKEVAVKVVDYQKKRGINHLMYTRIPDCCCHLWNNLTENNITPDTITKILNDPNQKINIADHTGCIPYNSLPDKPVPNTPSGFIPHTDTSGNNTYLADNIRSCLKKSTEEARKNNRVDDAISQNFYIESGGRKELKELSKHMESCKTYNTKLDGGLSAFFLFKNKNLANIPSNTPSTYKKDGILDKSWQSDSIKKLNDNLRFNIPSNWPTVAPFTTSGDGKIDNTYYYTSLSNIKYHLNINSILYEVGAYPVKKPDSNRTPITDQSAKNYLEQFLSNSNIEFNNTPSSSVSSSVKKLTKLELTPGWLWFPLN